MATCIRLKSMECLSPYRKAPQFWKQARFAGIKIPTLCFLKDLNEIGACRVCVVEVKGARSLVAACVHPVNEGMEILQILQE